SMHRVYDRVAAAVSVPVIHIADCVGKRMAANRVKTAALIGTRNVMLEDFYRKRLVAHGVSLLPPVMGNVDEIERVIYDDLMQGRAPRSAERMFKSMITDLEKAGAKAVVLGCTELEMVIDIDANVLPIYDGTMIHAEAAADWILGSA
ncbi:MAG: amino acid racemase, partial [Novosphingobium sp.]|nr:amino acid racemase [Novosphingobium sp.]